MPCGSITSICGNSHADIGWPILYTDCNLLSLYASRTLSSTSPFRGVVLSSLATCRITYCHSRVGDCGGTGYSIGAQTQAELAAASGLATIAARDKEPISGTILSIVSGIVGMFGQAHAQAVANEQSTLCKVADGWNSWAQAIEYGVSSGKMPLQDALNQLNQVYQSLKGTAQSVAKNTGDAANYYMAALDALQVWYAEVVLPSLVPAPILPAPVAGLLSGVTSALGISTQPGTPPKSKLLLWLIIGLVLAKLFGLFGGKSVVVNA